MLATVCVFELLMLTFVGVKEVLTETVLVVKAAVQPPDDPGVVELYTLAEGVENFEASLNVEVELPDPGSST